MNQKGFSLVELLATIVILSVVTGITIVATNGGFSKAKDKTEDIFIKTIEDALNIYIDSDAKSLEFDTSSSIYIPKRFGESNVYESTTTITLKNIINSEYTPLLESEVVNPANEEVKCNLDAPVTIYRDDDYVFYYYIAKADLECLKTTDNNIDPPCITNLITNLPASAMRKTSTTAIPIYKDKECEE